MSADETREAAAESATEAAEVELPRRGEVWQWEWLVVDIVRAGPKRVTYRGGAEVGSIPTDRFLARFHRTGLGTPPAESSTS